MADTKKYGLIIKKKTKENQFNKTSVFGNDSSDEEEAAKSNINVSLMREAQKKKEMKQTRIEIEKALQEDPTVYDYDNIYDEMVEMKKAAIPKLAEADRKPKYIKGLLEFAKSRKMEEERRMERKIQKEREQEGGEFQDKQEFVTSAYRTRMLELEEEEKLLKKQEAADAANDVTKRSDLTMFYSNLLEHNVSMRGTFTVDAQSENIGTDQDIHKNQHEKTASQYSKTSEHPKHSRKVADHVRGDRESHHDGGRSHRDSDGRRKDYDRRRRSSSEERSRRRDDHRGKGDKQRESQREHDTSQSSRRPSERHRDTGSRSDEQLLSSSCEDNKERTVPEKEQLHTVKTEVKSEQVTSSKFAKRSTNQTVSSARERFLERKRAREMMLQAKPTDDSDED